MQIWYNIHGAERTDHSLAYSGRQSSLGCSENARVEYPVEAKLLYSQNDADRDRQGYGSDLYFSCQ